MVHVENMKTVEEINDFKNESLGMAAFHMMHLALQTGSTFQEVTKKIRYLILKSWKLQYQQRSLFKKLICPYIILYYARVRAYLLPQFKFAHSPITQC